MVRVYVMQKFLRCCGTQKCLRATDRGTMTFSYPMEPQPLLLVSCVNLSFCRVMPQMLVSGFSHLLSLQDYLPVVFCVWCGAGEWFVLCQNALIWDGAGGKKQIWPWALWSSTLSPPVRLKWVAAKTPLNTQTSDHFFVNFIFLVNFWVWFVSNSKYFFVIERTERSDRSEVRGLRGVHTVEGVCIQVWRGECIGPYGPRGVCTPLSCDPTMALYTPLPMSSWLWSDPVGARRRRAKALRRRATPFCSSPFCWNLFSLFSLVVVLIFLFAARVYHAKPSCHQTKAINKIKNKNTVCCGLHMSSHPCSRVLFCSFMCCLLFLHVCILHRCENESFYI